MLSIKKKYLLLSLIALLGVVALASFAKDDETQNSVAESVVVVKEIKLSEGSGPDARLAANLLRLDVPKRGPLKTEELKHIQFLDQDGESFSLDDLKGDTVLINFMFASCVSVCPVQTIGLREVYKNLKLDPEKDRIKLLSISIAPLSDTPKVLKDYAKRFEMDVPNWRFAVTSNESTNELTEQFAVGVKPLEGEQLDHRSLLYLINPKGVLIQQYRGMQVDVKRLVKELRVVDQLSAS